MKKEISYMKMAVRNTAGEEQQVCISILKKLERARKLNKIRIAILKAITWIAVFLFFIGACSMDSEDITIPVMVMLASGLWLSLIIFANEKLR